MMAVKQQNKDKDGPSPSTSESAEPSQRRSIAFLLDNHQKWVYAFKILFCAFIVVGVVTIGMLLAVVTPRAKFEHDEHGKTSASIGEGIILSEQDSIIGKVQDVLRSSSGKHKRSTEVTMMTDTVSLPDSKLLFSSKVVTDVAPSLMTTSTDTVTIQHPLPSSTVGPEPTAHYFYQSGIFSIQEESLSVIETSDISTAPLSTLSIVTDKSTDALEYSVFTENWADPSSRIAPTGTIPSSVTADMTTDMKPVTTSKTYGDISTLDIIGLHSGVAESPDVEIKHDSEATKNENKNYYHTMMDPGVSYESDPSLLAENLVLRKLEKRYARNENSKTTECRERRVSLCNGILPYNRTTLPNIVGDTNDISINRTMPFFKLITKSSCNRRIRQLVCLIIEPMCYKNRPVPPCRKFCRVALEGCGEYIPATLSLSSVFQCERYPDSSNPTVCTNLARGNACFSDEFQCPDATCIPNHWKCDGVRDCIFASDEANCAGVSSACTSEEFMCDRKCVPSTWKCDGDRDCLDGTDERDCPTEPSCGFDRFRCADDSGCIPKRWVCDGKAECRDGSDENGCAQRDCAQGDFRCSNGICIPTVWRCDGQDDCRDNSDETNCLSHNIDSSPTSLYSRRLGFRIY